MGLFIEIIDYWEYINFILLSITANLKQHTSAESKSRRFNMYLNPINNTCFAMEKGKKYQNFTYERYRSNIFSATT